MRRRTNKNFYANPELAFAILCSQEKETKETGTPASVIETSLQRMFSNSKIKVSVSEKKVEINRSPQDPEIIELLEISPPKLKEEKEEVNISTHSISDTKNHRFEQKHVIEGLDQRFYINGLNEDQVKLLNKLFIDQTIIIPMKLLMTFTSDEESTPGSMIAELLKFTQIKVKNYGFIVNEENVRLIINKKFARKLKECITSISLGVIKFIRDQEELPNLSTTQEILTEFLGAECQYKMLQSTSEVTIVCKDPKSQQKITTIQMRLLVPRSKAKKFEAIAGGAFASANLDCVSFFVNQFLGEYRDPSPTIYSTKEYSFLIPRSLYDKTVEELKEFEKDHTFTIGPDLAKVIMHRAGKNDLKQALTKLCINKRLTGPIYYQEEKTATKNTTLVAHRNTIDILKRWEPVEIRFTEIEEEDIKKVARGKNFVDKEEHSLAAYCRHLGVIIVLFRARLPMFGIMNHWGISVDDLKSLKKQVPTITSTAENPHRICSTRTTPDSKASSQSSSDSRVDFTLKS